MSDNLPPPTPFPSPPWVCSGAMWTGIFRADAPVAIPPDLQPLASSRWIVVGLVRYLRGPLTYDELIAGPLARRGLQLGIDIQHIWVDDAASLWGGRRIWGLPKQMATFHWRGSAVDIADAGGPIARLTVDARAALLPRLPLLAPAFGCRDGRRSFFVARGMARLGAAAMRVEHWSARFPYQIGPRPFVSVAAKPFHLTIPEPAALSSRC